MVNIRYCRDIGKLWFDGHAEYAERGEDKWRMVKPQKRGFRSGTAR